MSGAESGQRPSTGRESLRLLFFLAITFAAAAVGAQFMPGSWYAELVKPAWTPPNWLFGPVWTALYVMIAVAGWLVWRRQSRVGTPLVLWGTQLVLNGIWSWLFFGLERPGLAALDIVVLLVLIATTALAFMRVSRVAALLLVPYLAWVGFASALNIAIWQLNA